MTTEDPYGHFQVKATELSFNGCWGCSFCGALVMPSMWDDHVDWHRTLEIQASAVMKTALLKMEEDLS